MLNKDTQISITENTLKLRQSIVSWLTNFLVKSNKEGYVLGMSGGIDSAVTALLSKEAVDKINKKVLVFILPIDNDCYDEESAISVCEQFGIKYKLLNITTTYNILKTELNDTTNKPVLYTNLKARLRECVIYFYANNLNYLVLGTINKGEYTLGYFPKNSVAGDLLPLADLLKKEIRAIGKSYDLKDEIVNRKASGCTLEQTAEEEWGFTEDELDIMLSNFDGSDESLKNLKEISPEKIQRFLKSHRATFHKRKFYPIFSKVSK